MADKAISELVAAEKIKATDLFVLEQDGTAKKLTGQILENWLVSFADGHGGIQSIEKTGTTGLVDTYRITLADTTTFDFAVTNGKSIVDITKTATAGLVDTYTITYNDGTESGFVVANGRGIKSWTETVNGLSHTYTITYNDGTSDTFTVNDGKKGDKGDNAYAWIKYASQEPTASSHSMGDVPDNWMGVYTGTDKTAPTDWTAYQWFRIKGEQGNTGDPAKLVSNTTEYQVSESGTIQPSEVWTTTIPVVAQGKYLWTRTTTTFNTGSPVVSYSVARMGMDGIGSVSSVAGLSPDENGNVPLAAENVGALPLSGGAMTGPIDMQGQTLTGLNQPTADTQAASKAYVDTQARKAAPGNLLDNSDFRNPVNQRGAASVSAKGAYPIDRWQFSFDGDDQIGACGIDTENKWLYLANTGAVSAGNTMIFQKIPVDTVHPGAYTLAVHQTTNAPVSALVCMDGAVHANTAPQTPDDNGTLLLRFSVTARPVSEFVVYIYAPSQTTLCFDWAALYEGEYTAETLPEYRSKGYAHELMACKRYYLGFDKFEFYPSADIQPNYIDFTIPIPVRMRTVPSVVGADRISLTSLGFTLSVAVSGQNMLRARAYKEAHGISGGFVYWEFMPDGTTPVGFSADL